MMTILEKVDLLRRAEMLQEIRTESLARIGAIASEIESPSSTSLYSENQAADRIFLVVRGEVALTQNGQNQRRVGDGALLGFLPALSEGTYTEAATTVAACHFLQIEQQDLADLMASDFHITRAIIKSLVRLCTPRDL